MGRLILVRHGSTSPSHTRTQDGWINHPLSDVGRAEAKAIGSKICIKLAKIDLICSSDLDRALETALIINDKIGAPVFEEASLRPWHLGDSKLPSTIENMFQRESLKTSDGESFGTFKVRFLKRLQELIDISKNGDKNIVVVTHLRNLRLAEAWLNAGARPDLYLGTDLSRLNSIEPVDYMEVPAGNPKTEENKERVKRGTTKATSKKPSRRSNK